MASAQNSQNREEKTASVHLKSYYYTAEIFGALGPIVIGGLGLLFPDAFRLLVGYEYPLVLPIVLIWYGLSDAIFLFLHELTGKNIFFNLNRYLFVVLFVFIIVATGGVNSSLIFLLIFPFIVSLVYLDLASTRNIGIFVTVLFSLIIFTHNPEEIDQALIVKHVLQTLIVAGIAYYIYRIVVGTLHVQYEKQETDRRLAELIHLDHLKADFLSVAQHRLRTPLSGIRWSLETLAGDNQVSPANRPIIDDSLQRTKDAINIVNEMLKAAEDAPGSFVNVYPVRFDLVELVRSIVKELNYLAVRNKNFVRLDLPARLDIEADTKKIYAALSNIIDNAIRYTKKGQVTISLKLEDQSASLRVIDTGMGVTIDDLPYVFNRLHRGKNAVLVEPDESGVGLYVSKKIIEMHGGQISLNSKLNEGTQVVINLPLKSARLEKIENPPNQEA